MPIATFDVEFTKMGELFDETQATKLLQALPAFSDLFVVSHGWNNDMAEARELYSDLFMSISKILDASLVKSVAGRTFGAMHIFWPSKRFADEDLIPGGGAASLTVQSDSLLLRQLEELKIDPIRLGGKDKDPGRVAALSKAQSLIQKLDNDEDARREYVLLLRSILNPAQAHLDDASLEFFRCDPEELFTRLASSVSASSGISRGGATSISGAADLADLADGITAAARRMANYATYYTMKERAGIVGESGVANLLNGLRAQKRDIRIHMIGHSFGGRLVTAAANRLPTDTPTVTLSLLQAAYSHNGLADNFDNQGHSGSFRGVLADRRVSGPIIITHTKNDTAVGIAYPLASRLARDHASALGDESDPYGGMGRNGAQYTPEARGLNGTLLNVGRPYTFSQGKVFNLQADDIIKNHGDVTGPQVAYAILNAAGAV